MYKQIIGEGTGDISENNNWNKIGNANDKYVEVVNKSWNANDKNLEVANERVYAVNKKCNKGGNKNLII